MLRAGQTFLLPKDQRLKEHSWIVVTDTDPHDGTSVCVSVTTWRAGCDETVILEPGDHPFVAHRSVVYYQDTKKLSAALVEQLLELNKRKGNLTFTSGLHANCTYKTLDRIKAGLLASTHISKDIKKYCKELWQPS